MLSAAAPDGIKDYSKCDLPFSRGALRDDSDSTLGSSANMPCSESMIPRDADRKCCTAVNEWFADPGIPTPTPGNGDWRCWDKFPPNAVFVDMFPPSMGIPIPADCGEDVDRREP